MEKEIPDWLTTPGIKFTKEDIEDAMRYYFIVHNGAKYYYAKDPFAYGPNLFCIERDEMREYLFLWDDKHRLFNEETFLKIGENPNLLVMM